MMQGQELRRLREAHGLTVHQLAKMLAVLPDTVRQCEAPPDDPSAQPISADMRRLILRQLALYRDRQDAARDLMRPRHLPAQFRPTELLIPSSATVR